MCLCKSCVNKTVLSLLISTTFVHPLKSYLSGQIVNVAVIPEGTF